MTWIEWWPRMFDTDEDWLLMVRSWWRGWMVTNDDWWLKSWMMIKELNCDKVEWWRGCPRNNDWTGDIFALPGVWMKLCQVESPRQERVWKLVFKFEIGLHCLYFRSFFRLFVHVFIRSFFRSFVRSYLCALCMHLFVRSFVRVCVRSFSLLSVDFSPPGSISLSEQRSRFQIFEAVFMIMFLLSLSLSVSL